jgi:hypothetical protein
MNQGEKILRQRDVTSISPKVLAKMIDRAKKFLKNDKIMKQVFKDHDVDMEFMDYIPIKFGKIDVSATTSRGVITLNFKLLQDGDFFKDYGYLIHEITHYLQQCFGDKPTQGADEGSYLDNPAEQEGFQNQIKYIDHHHGEEEAEEYVESLLDHHDVHSKKEREDKKDALMSKV